MNSRSMIVSLIYLSRSQLASIFSDPRRPPTEGATVGIVSHVAPTSADLLSIRKGRIRVGRPSGA